MGPRTLLSLCMTGLGALVVAAALALVAGGCGASAAPEPIPQTMRTAAATP